LAEPSASLAQVDLVGDLLLDDQLVLASTATWAL
jgi:hypothetical protein